MMDSDKNENKDVNQDVNQNVTQALDDERRVKVLSPAMLVVKRFFRNALSVVGLVMLGLMALFSFGGGVVSPYGEAEQFYRHEYMEKNYATAKVNDDLRVYPVSQEAFPTSAFSAVHVAVATGKYTFTANKATFTLFKESDDVYLLAQRSDAGTVTEKIVVAADENADDEEGSAAKETVERTFSAGMDEAVQEGFSAARESGAADFTVGSTVYTFAHTSKDEFALTADLQIGKVIVPKDKTQERLFEGDISEEVKDGFNAAYKAKKTMFEIDGAEYVLTDTSAPIFTLNAQESVGKVTVPRKKTVERSFSDNISEGMQAAFNEAYDGKETSFLYDGEEFFISGSGTDYAITRMSEPVGVVDMFIYDTTDFKEPDFALRLAADLAIGDGLTAFEFASSRYEIDYDGDVKTIFDVTNGGRVMYANVSSYLILPYRASAKLTIEFKDTIKDAISEGRTKFAAVDPEFGDEREFVIRRSASEWEIMRVEETTVLNMFELPTSSHIAGTDEHGMDMLTRLMYGGRVSLIVGFVVVFIELFIGVILGGLAGYFGKWVDNLLMRIVDIINCIPSLPLLIILGSAMDGMHVDAMTRLLVLMLLLGFLGWPGIARLVRGQILSLREQEFMVATEATGVSVYRRIFRHLLPNVMPQLIVTSTMSLGGIILTESSLSFLGVGVKYPFASWGNIINAVSNIYVMKTYLYCWIPAGICILITVLGFNFVGDGLRDAFDPKMKR